MHYRTKPAKNVYWICFSKKSKQFIILFGKNWSEEYLCVLPNGQSNWLEIQ